MKPYNPFLVYGYNSPEYFCDREKETDKMISALQNERNLTLISPDAWERRDSSKMYSIE